MANCAHIRNACFLSMRNLLMVDTISCSGLWALKCTIIKRSINHATFSKQTVSNPYTYFFKILMSYYTAEILVRRTTARQTQLIIEQRWRFTDQMLNPHIQFLTNFREIAVMHSEKFQPASLNKLITYTYNIKNDAAYLATQIFRFRWM
ncbi:hypothetical protein ABG067_004689 [Albugo candida]|uniref:Uncharacterized protein n=1 Tax=Albugo candida TaxID=65357 RepID=A0A024GJX6_9STRA|nr:unnamed protein product [Albugo candida]CCI49114.1 unnamed protein product [Albugo candida]|eukprot:CCI46634.1 unnamed protein product [Albugo candida]